MSTLLCVQSEEKTEETELETMSPVEEEQYSSDRTSLVYICHSEQVCVYVRTYIYAYMHNLFSRCFVVVMCGMPLFCVQVQPPADPFRTELQVSDCSRAAARNYHKVFPIEHCVIWWLFCEGGFLRNLANITYLGAIP